MLFMAALHPAEQPFSHIPRYRLFSGVLALLLHRSNAGLGAQQTHLRHLLSPAQLGDAVGRHPQDSTLLSVSGPPRRLASSGARRSGGCARPSAAASRRSLRRCSGAPPRSPPSRTAQQRRERISKRIPARTHLREAGVAATKCITSAATKCITSVGRFTFIIFNGFARFDTDMFGVVHMIHLLLWQLSNPLCLSS